MTLQPNDALVGTLAELTAADRGEPELWARALRGVRGQGPAPAGRARRLLSGAARGPWVGRVAGLAAVVVLGVVAISIGARAVRSPLPSVASGPVGEGAKYRSAPSFAYGFSGTDRDGADREDRRAPSWKKGAEVVDKAWRGEVERGTARVQPEAPAARQVVRTCTLELKSPDVRAAFAKVGTFLSDAQGEFIEQTGMTGDGPTLTASVKLRVAAARVGVVLSELRSLGAVVSEATTGEDVTDQAVDLDARLRNEQKVEAELASLLESRHGAPLDDVLKVRESLSKVRESIERLTAQRDQLSRLVALATIQVVFRADAPPPPEPKKTGLGEYFSAGISQSWDAGMKGLADSAAWLVRTAISGLFGWVLLIVVLLGVRLAWHRYTRALAQEPAPRL